MKRNETTLFLLLIAFSVVLFLLDRSGLLSSVRGVIERAVSPGAKEVHKLATGGRAQDSEIGQEKLQELAKLKKENEDLRLQLGIAKEGSAQKHTLAHVLSTSRFFIIDKGQDDDIALGNVVVFKNILIGKVIIMSKYTSRVLLPRDRESVIEVKTTQTGARGLIKGQGETMLLSEVILSENLTEGDTAATIGDIDEKGLGIRPGLLVGKIENIRKSENQLFQEATVVPLLDFKTLENVFVAL